jgi:hypothetical protein
MTVSELIERLEEYRLIHGDDCEVRLQTQENWPFENDINGLCSADELAASCGDCDEDDQAEEIEPVVYLVEGSQLGYGTKAAWEAAY